MMSHPCAAPPCSDNASLNISDCSNIIISKLGMACAATVFWELRVVAGLAQRLIGRQESGRRADTLAEHPSALSKPKRGGGRGGEENERVGVRRLVIRRQ